MDYRKILEFIDSTIKNDYRFETSDLKSFTLPEMREMFSLVMIRVDSKEINLRELIRTLDQKVRERTEELEIKNRQLEVANQELYKSLERVKLLSGLLPICSHCKKIRDDKGYWMQVEEFISDHSEAIFSHGICPACLKELYPEFYEEKFGKVSPESIQQSKLPASK